ncbi:MAG TPA: AIPR family protein [Mesorhizobium sp.]|jgi:hypothetical protein|nr:AIPR family protein [Mesorhizobium sp.]
MDAPSVEFESFRHSWLESITEGTPTSTVLGRRFALKLVTQWIDASEATADFVYCDGARDGGIDVAILDTGPDDSNDEPEESGHSWYLVQSKYGSAFSGTETLLLEGQKVIDTLDGKRPKLNSLAEGLLERLTNFRNGASQSDRIVLVFATERGLSESEKRVLEDLRAMGRARIGTLFDVEAISIETIFQRLQEQAVAKADQRLTVELDAKMVHSGPDLLVGSINLTNLYVFLKAYRNETGDLDRIYEKNVRRFLGARGKVNRAMQGTLRDAPERFGLYNNGITVVVHDFALGEDKVKLVEPYIVNGCQTTRTVWEVCHQKLSSGGTGNNPERDHWKDRADAGVVVAKIVKVGDTGGEALLRAITRYTNSQNAVREKDFLALTGDFKTWQIELAERYDLYLEIQRGGWDSQKALQNTNIHAKQFTKHANAADLIKVFGAGWLGEAGLAFGKNPPFLPDGSIFKKIVNATDADGGPFGASDLYAAYLLQQATANYGFGRSADKQSRRQTRFLFYMVALELLKDVMTRASLSTDQSSLSSSMIKVMNAPDAKAALLDQAIEVIDSYLTQGSDDSIFLEPSYLNTFNSDLNAFLKSEQIGKSDTATPRLRQNLAVNKNVMGRSVSGQPSPRQVITNSIAKPN